MNPATEDESYGKITDEKIRGLKNRIGEQLDPPKPPFLQQVTRDAIRHWANGIGTDNPLYTVEDYAFDSPYGDLIAPPTILLSAMSHYTMGLPGVHGMWAGTDWKWFRPVQRGDEIQLKTWLSDVEEKETNFGGRAVVNTYTTEFYDQEGERFGSVDEWNFRVERKRHGSEDRQEYNEDQSPHADWSDDDIQGFIEHYQSESPRGSEPRYFGEVEVGEKLDTLLKGPLTLTSIMTFNMGFGGVFLQTDRLLYETFGKNPSLMVDSKYGAPEPPECVHWNEEFAKEAGVPTAYDYGNQRVGWLGHVVHHWMSDYGFLKDLYVELREHNFIGDITWCSGEVVDKRVKGNEHLVDVDLEGRNQRDQITTKGSAVIRLPRENGNLENYIESVNTV